VNLLCSLNSEFVYIKNNYSCPFYADKEITPKTVNDLKLINGGKILENSRTLAESRVTIGEVPGGVITMHVVVRPPQADKNRGIADHFTFLFLCVPGSIDDLFCSLFLRLKYIQ
jgi:hypothetical protein